MNCRLEFLYYLTRAANNDIGLHKHGCYELVYYISGQGATKIDGADFQYAPGTFAIIRPDTLHDERHKTKTDVLFIGFRFSNLPVELRNGLYKDTPSKSIFRVLQKLKDEMLGKKAFYELKLESYLQELTVEIIRALSIIGTGIKRDFSYIEHFLSENYFNDVDFNTVAELSGYSYHRFRHIFKEVYGLSPYHYVMRLRLDNAGKMLASTDYPILRIAQENGFSSQSQFCSLFKRMYGCTPKCYRKSGSQKRPIP